MRHARSDYDHIQDLHEIPDLKQAFDACMQMQAWLPSIDVPLPSDLREISLRLSALLRVLHPLVSDNVTSGRSTIPFDEPVFVLRAKDQTAPSVVRAWARLNQSSGPYRADRHGASLICQAALAQADRMEDYAREHYNGGKEADAPEGTLRINS